MILSHFLVCLYVRHYGKIYDGQHEAILDKACGSKSKTNFQKMLYAPEAEHVTSLALQNLLTDLKAEQSNLSVDMFLKNRQEVLQLSIRELTETVVLFRDRLEVTLSKSIADRLGLKKTVCVSYWCGLNCLPGGSKSQDEI